MDVHNYASKGVANAGLTTGIIGTSLGALNAMGGAGGLLGGLFGGNNCGCNGAWNMAGCSENVLVNRYELGQAQEIESLKSQIALRDANTFTDSKMLEMYKYIDGKLGEINGVLCGQAVQNQATKDSFQLMQERLECCKHEMREALCREIGDRKCADNAIVNYVNATFYPKMVADVTTGTTTTAQMLYNPLPIDSCGC
jgi:hypothetical protein